MTPSTGSVTAWHDDEGWGAIASDATPGGCWVHVSAVVDGGRSLAADQAVSFTFEAAEQDGFAFRALEAWPTECEPDRAHQVRAEGASAAYRSDLSLTLDDADG